MFIVDVVIILLWLAAAFGALTQLIIPLAQNRPVFPVFRSRRKREIDSAISKTNEELEITDLQRRLEELTTERERRERELQELQLQKEHEFRRLLGQYVGDEPAAVYDKTTSTNKRKAAEQ
jgi:flagellar biosynthesis component FlhA